MNKSELQTEISKQMDCYYTLSKFDAITGIIPHLLDESFYITYYINNTRFIETYNKNTKKIYNIIRLKSTITNLKL